VKVSMRKRVGGNCEEAQNGSEEGYLDVEMFSLSGFGFVSVRRYIYVYLYMERHMIRFAS